MNKIITVTLKKQEHEKLHRLALQYGLSLKDFTKKILIEINETIPTESFKDYTNPKKAKASYERGLRDWRAGRVVRKI